MSSRQSRSSVSLILARFKMAHFIPASAPVRSSALVATGLRTKRTGACVRGWRSGALSPNPATELGAEPRADTSSAGSDSAMRAHEMCGDGASARNGAQRPSDLRHACGCG
eukprot:4114699-Pleurochrysis_carterae.AAC.1